MTGDNLKIEELAKDGYRVDQGELRSFEFNQDANSNVKGNNLVVFVMMKNGSKSPLITKHLRANDLIPDGRIYRIDLTRGMILAEVGEKSEKTDLYVAITQTNFDASATRYDWSLTIRAPNGGVLQQTATPYFDMLFAPTDGYSKVYEEHHLSSQEKWSRSVGRKAFYVKFNSGPAYAKILLDVDASLHRDPTKAGIQLEYILNPSGSPMLR